VFLHEKLLVPDGSRRPGDWILRFEFGRVHMIARGSSGSEVAASIPAAEGIFQR